MYNNIGKKIKILAQVVFLIEAIVSVIAGLVIWVESESLSLWSVVFLFVGPLVAYISSWILYGYGEIIVKLFEIERNTHKEQSETDHATEKSERNPAENTIQEKEEQVEQKTEKQELGDISVRDEANKDECIVVTCPKCHEKVSLKKADSEAKCTACQCVFLIKYSNKKREG